MNAIGKAHNKSSAQVALRWVVQQGIVAVTSSDELNYDEVDPKIRIYIDAAWPDEHTVTHRSTCISSVSAPLQNTPQ